MAAVLPVSLKLVGKKCAVIGGGAVALRRVKALHEAGAQIRVIAPEIDSELLKFTREENIEWIAEPFTASLVLGMFLVVCATNDESANRSAAWAAKATGALVNMAAPPMDLSDLMFPAFAEKDGLLLTASTNGASPELSRKLRQELEGIIDVYGPWLEILAPIREEMKEKLAGSTARQAFWREALDDAVMALVKEKKYDEAEAQVRNAIGRFGTES
ncbi:MAG: bifunctional precorrin-2 dehydrogenase/sirohydrochlorin ferrochelatase [Schwartzia sp.]|nr:bifunctional precorrin-2 dehydrogenase/sirohydrochlorin ferrochelatase [Schwartzia sp. (in: firmicutes)]